MSDTVFFPSAGSFGGEWRSLLNALVPEIWCVRYPGRFGEQAGIPAGSFQAVVRACVEQITGRGPDRPVLLGHSFGAYVAYATAVALQETGVEVAARVTAGAPAPSLLNVDAQAGPRDAAAYLERVDPAVLAAAPSDDWRDMVAGLLADDLRLLTQFDTTSPVHCPVFATRGQSDPATSSGEIRAWREVTGHDFAARTFPGGHSDFLSTPACTAWLRTILAGAGITAFAVTRSG